MKLSERRPFTFNIRVPANSHCLEKLRELSASERTVSYREINPASIAKAVIEHAGEGLSPRERRELSIFALDPRFDEFNPAFCSSILKNFSSAKRFWPKLFSMWLYFYKPSTEVGGMVLKGLQENRRFLTDLNKKTDNTFDVLAVNDVTGRGPQRREVVENLLNEQISKESLQEIYFSVDGVSGGKFSNEFLLDIAQFCMKNSLSDVQLKTLIKLLCPTDIIHESIKEVVLVSFIYGIESQNEKSNNYLKAKEIINNNYQDPRMYLNTWPTISKRLGGQETRQVCVDTVKKWHIFQSIQLFFKIIEEVVMDGEQNHQFPKRREFWLKYFLRGWVSEAWVILGTKGVKEALGYKSSGDEVFSNLTWGKLSSAKNDQCVLLMKIGNMTVVEWSHSGACRVWKSDDLNAPKFNNKAYVGEELRADVFDEDKDRITHDPSGNWENKITNRINEYSGIRRSV